MSTRGLIGMAFVLMSLAGCSVAYVSQPLGETPLVLSADEWEGTWVHKEGALTIKVLDAKQGRIQVGWIESNQDRLKLLAYDIALYRSGDWVFGNAKESPSSPNYLWARVKNEGGQITVWFPDMAQLERLVKEGVLPGAVDEDDNVFLAPLTPDQMRVITSGSHGSVLDWDEPIVLIHISR